MTLPASGAISFSAVNIELGLSSTAQISLNDAAVRTLFGDASGAVTMSDAYGKSNTTVPGTPTIGTATATGSTTATVSFTAPASNGGLTITSYTAVSSPGGITGTLSQAGSGTITVSGLSGGTSYTFTVYATNSKGNSSSSSSSNSITTTPVIGQSFGGGYYAGQISTAGNGVADYNLIIGPNSSAYSSSLYYKTSNSSDSGIPDSVIDGPANSTAINDSDHPAAQFCKGLSIGGYSDWYLPAKNEMQVCYFNLKPTTSNNSTSDGINPNAVPAKTSNYTTGTPSQTSATLFQSGQSEEFSPNLYWTSTELVQNGHFEYAIRTTWLSGQQFNSYKANTNRVRATRRVAV